MTRSNSVTAAVQADLDLSEELERAGYTSRQPSRESSTSTVSIQGSGNHYHACSPDDYSSFDPSVLPPPEPWMDTNEEDEQQGSGVGVPGSVCPRDGRWFLKLLQAEVERMEGWCQQMEEDEHENDLPDESE